MTVPASPYKGLASFEDSELDELLFFGREREREIIAANLMATRLTVLYGETGVGKSSVLRAAVVRHLRALPEPLEVVVFDDWQDDPAAALRAQLADAVGAEPTGSLADTLELCAALAGGEVFVVLDGLEEYFLYHGSEEEADSFLEDFSEAVSRPGLRASFLLAVREDALAKLDRFKGRIPNVLGNYLRLDHLDRSSAREAIVGPVDRFNELSADGSVEIEPALVEAVLDQVAAGKVELGEAGRGGVDEDATGGRIEAPFLQLVMARLWEAERATGSRVLRLQTLHDLGGAEQIVRDHLDGALAALSPEQQDLAASIFNHLVTPSGTKIAHDAADLAGYVGADRSQLAPVLASLAGQRILRPVPGVPGSDLPRYEIYHDILADAVLAWRTRHEAARQLERVRAAAAKRQRRLLVVAAAAVVLAGAMAGVTIFAFTQRSEADAQARKAQARALDASALSQLSVDPELSLLLATESARRDRGSQAEDVLRRALLASRERGIFLAGGPISAAQFSPDGSRILVAGADGKARVYDAHSRKLLLTLVHGAPITAAGFSSDGRLVVSAGSDGRARLWSSNDGHLLRVLRHGGAIRSASFDRATRVVTAGGHSAKVWRVSDGALILARRFNWPVTRAVASRYGRYLAAAGNNPDAFVYDTVRRKLLHRFTQGNFVKDVAFSPDDKQLATAGRNRTARLWDVRSGRLLHELKGHQGEVLAVSFSPDGKLLATVSSDGNGRIWNVASGDPVAALVGHTHFVVSVSFSPDGKSVVTSSTDGTARVWRTADGEFEALLTGDSDSVTTAVFSPDSRRVLTASDDGSARLWDPQTQPRLKALAHEGTTLLGALPAGPGGLLLVADPGKPQALLVRATDGSRVRTLKVRRDVTAVAASADGGALAVAAGRRVSVFGKAGQLLRIVSQPSVVMALAFSADGTQLATGGSDAVVRMTSLVGNAPARELKGHRRAITAVTFNPDGTLLATASRDGTARIWDVRTGVTRHALARDTNDVTSVAFSPDGQALLTGSRDADARLWSVATGRQEQLLRWHFGAVSDASFSPDGRWIVTAGPTTLQLWQPGVRTQLLPRGIFGPSVTAVFAPGSRTILAAGQDGSLLSYRCTLCGGLDELLQLARGRLALTGRALTHAERKQYGL